MLKILLVDDEQEKRRQISELLLSFEEIKFENITVRTDVHEAKRAISQEKFDLLILDINLPKRMDVAPERGAGLDVLNFLKVHPKAIAPTYVVGLTAYSESAAEAATLFTSALWKLISFSHSSTDWQEPLRAAVRFLIAKNRPPYATDGMTYHTDLAILVALENEELSAVLSLPGTWKPLTLRHDSNQYFEGTFEGPDGSLSVIATAAPRMGMPAAAVTAAKLIESFRPRFLAMSGICAGVKGKCELGDILVADPCFDWGSGKWEQGKDELLRFRPALYPWRLDEAIRSRVVELCRDKAVMEALWKGFEGPIRPNKPPTVLTDAMASGGSVLQSQVLVDEVRDLHKNLVGLEMESYAVFTAASYCAAPQPKCISIKSVCDFGDQTKSDNFHNFAAYASARFLYELALRNFARPTIG